MDDEQLDRALRSVGKDCFVRFYTQFADAGLSRVDMIEVLRQETTYSEISCGTRTSTARSIIESGRGRDALGMIVNARVPDAVRAAALSLLGGETPADMPTPIRTRTVARTRRAEPGPHRAVFKMPNAVKIMGRSSSITNSFVNSIIPVIEPTDVQVRQALEILGMTPDTIECAYCGSVTTEWDHLRPLVMNKMPTGYISEIHNLVPACGKCNQSKGNKEWKTWMLSDAKLSPKTRGVENLEARMARLQGYEHWEEPTQLDFESIVGSEAWASHWENCEKVMETMASAQILADEIRDRVGAHYAQRGRGQ
jgi:5-methylcytosine-specific restriction endonuclease McrA